MQRAAGDVNGCALTLGLLAELATDEGDDEAAVSLYEESLSLFREAGNRPQIARSLLELAGVEWSRGRPDAARRLLGEATTEYFELGNPRGLAETLERLATVAAADGNHEDETLFLDAARALRTEPGAFDPRDVVDVARRWAAT